MNGSIHLSVFLFSHLSVLLRSLFFEQEVMAFPENQPYEFRLLSGEAIRLQPDGSFYVDGQKCAGDTFLGVDGCN